MTGSFRALPRLLALYGVLYAAFGVHSPYFPALLDERGLRAEAIGFVLAAGAGVRLIAGPAAGRLADWLEAPKAVLAFCLIASALIGLIVLPATGFWPLLSVAVAYAAAVAPLAPLTDTIALGSAAPAPRGASGSGRVDYGWLRGAGSAAFILGSIFSGQAVGRFGIEIVVLLNAALLAAAALCAPWAPVLLPGRPRSGSQADSLGREDLRTLLQLPMFLRLLLVAALVLSSHALHDGFIVIRWGAAGIGPETAGLLWSEQVAAEVVVFFFLGRPLLHQVGAGGALALAAAAGAIRWAVMAQTAWLPAMAMVEPLHGFTFALLHLACMRLLAEIVPPRHAATALALYGTVAIGAAAALVTLISGPLYAQLGAYGFWAMAALCAAALPIALTIREPDGAARL